MSVQLETITGRATLRERFLGDLLNNTVPFWFPRSIDHEHGGFLHCFDRNGELVDTDKSIWVQGRMSWMLSALYNTVEKRAEWLTWSESGLAFLERHGFDSDGRMFFHVTREGRPIRKRRYAYSESFAAIAYAAHARTTGDSRSAERAFELFDFFTIWNFLPGQMPPKFTEERPLTGMGPRMITIVTAQELRENLGEDVRLTAFIDCCCDEIERLFVKHDLRVVMESVAPDGSISDHFDGRLLNPGHAIEGAWFLMWEGRHRNDSRLIRLGCDMLDYMWERGWDELHGGLFYFRDVYHKPVQEYWAEMKFWWPHNETIIATLLAYLLTGEPRYAERFEKVLAWSESHFADCEHGEWYGYLHRDGTPANTLKGNLWKSFFHHPRMQWMCARMLAEIVPPSRVC